MKNMAEPKNSQETLGGEEIETAAQLAESTAATLFYDQQHISQLMPAVEKSKDPSRVVGTALGQIILVSYTKLNKADLGVDERVWASDGGVIDNMLDEALEFFSEAGVQLDPEVTAQAILNVLKDSPVVQPEMQGSPPSSQPQPVNMAAPQGVTA